MWRLALRLSTETRARPADPPGLRTRWVGGPGGGSMRLRAGGPAAARRKLVLIHGVVVSGRYLTALGAILCRDFAVTIPDLPGYGLSDAPPPGQGLADLADAALAAAEPGAGERLVLVGNSFGAQIAIEAAIRHPERVERVALIGPTTDPDARSLPRQYLRWQRCAPDEQPAVFPLMARDLLDMGPRRAIGLLGVMRRDRPEQKLAAVGQPALVIRGERDRIAPREWCRQVIDLLPAGRLAEIPAAGHMPHGSDPGAVAAVLRDFLT